MPRKRLLPLLALLPGPALAAPGDLTAYFHARAARADGHADTAAHDYAVALAAAPDNPLVAIRAYREGLEAGDLALVDRAAAVLARAGVAPADASLQQLAKAARARDLPAARAAIAELSRGPLAPLTPALGALIAHADGQDPFASLENVGPDPVARRLAAETRALLLIERGRAEDGLAAIRALVTMPGASADLRFDAARALTGQGKTVEARSLLASDDPVLSRLRETLGDGVPPSLGHDISRLFTRLGVALAGGGEPSPLVIALGRAALRADPGNDRARLLLADELTRRAAYPRSLALLDGVDARGPFAGVARSSRVAVLAAMGDAGAALSAARSLAERADASLYDIGRYGELLLAAQRAGEAATQYRRVVDQSPNQSDAWLQYGSALDQAHRWPEARAALERAVALGPDQPLALNYLGYARIEHGEARPASEAMLERAARLKPDDAAITDSLAWAYFQRGQVARALPMLEQAVEGEPGNEEIAEHLGDAYWAAGRRFEARYLWRAAALLADAGDAPRLAIKIARGPDGSRR